MYWYCETRTTRGGVEEERGGKRMHEEQEGPACWRRDDFA